MIYKKADEDADCLIVKAIALASVCGCHRKRKIAEKIFSPHTVLEKTIADDILFIHAMSGCDTSALFNYVKLKFVQTLKNNNDLLKVIEIFKNPDMTPEAAMDVGNRFLVALFGYPITTSYTPSLNKLCYKCYMKSSFNKSSNMALLRSCPPTFPKSLLSYPALAWQ
ncbi:hypothetical protein AVEN_165152-1 [Araneus ventricosus]|uniref:Uncharacterized protein n=1 Tax=Araneus ventricosus TaxID=182803 RepID=A0A4Y2B6Y8_ARAVE|nr:hypothetical protein AVEN_165152-1 [Araneus ventricosus]